MAPFFFLVFLALQGVPCILCCKPATPVETFSPEHTFEAAPIIIYGQYASDFTGAPDGESPPFTSKHVIVSVHCTLKNTANNATIPSASNLTLNGNFMWHSCFHSELSPNSTYLMALTRVSEDPDGFFRVFEPNVASVGTFPPTEENFRVARKLCDGAAGARDSELDACGCGKDVNDTMSIGEGEETNSGMKLSGPVIPSLFLLMIGLILDGYF